jgi:starvation-inducible outer membrane lipoprotein
VNVKIFLSFVLFTCTVFLSGCSSMPSGEKQNREALQQYEADKKSEEFARSLPPAR